MKREGPKERTEYTDNHSSLYNKAQESLKAETPFFSSFIPLLIYLLSIGLQYCTFEVRNTLRATRSILKHFRFLSVSIRAITFTLEFLKYATAFKII